MGGGGGLQDEQFIFLSESLTVLRYGIKERRHMPGIPHFIPHNELWNVLDLCCVSNSTLSLRYSVVHYIGDRGPFGT